MADLQALLTSILEERDISGRFGLSVYSRAGLTAIEIAELVGTDKLPHPQMRVSTVGQIRQEGIDVIPDEGEGPAHALVVYENEPDLATLAHLVARFGDPVANPVRR